MDQQSLIKQQFGEMAQNYLTSPVHARGADLDKLAYLTNKLQPLRVLDLGCGAGHASFAMASGGALNITAYDLSETMLAIVQNEAASRGFQSITTCQGPVERLPFENGLFDLIVTRFSAHHWQDMDAALAEIARVASPQGTLVVIDIVAPEVPLYDTVLQSVELLRDASHVRDYRLTEWKSMLEKKGFLWSDSFQWKLHLEFNSWITRIGTSLKRVEALKITLDELPQEVKQYFCLGTDYSFSIDSAWIQARRL
ncbi:MAG: methyltransferase domain-containing protein [Proteobacteria bacterium]|nr:methyltransferase domain-containing protein [Pseudomonadota bacterium]MDE3208271.1 class I SAM-dependent methyltransferase [Pseudomonadota bacterium]